MVTCTFSGLFNTKVVVAPLMLRIHGSRLYTHPEAPPIAEHRAAFWMIGGLAYTRFDISEIAHLGLVDDERQKWYHGARISFPGGMLYINDRSVAMLDKGGKYWNGVHDKQQYSYIIIHAS